MLIMQVRLYTELLQYGLEYGVVDDLSLFAVNLCEKCLNQQILKKRKEDR